MHKKYVPWLVLVGVLAVLLVLDLWLKSWAAANLAGEEGRVIIPGVLGLYYTRNTGAAFSMFANFDWARWFLTGVKIAITIGLFLYYSRLPLENRFWWLRVPIILIIAGGIGNLYDRLVLGYVRDMFEFLFMNFAIFNLADVFVVVGCFTGAFVILFVCKDAPFLSNTK